jgi:type VI protein secretion system component VasK
MHPLTPDEALAGLKQARFATSELLLLGAIALVVLAVLIWAVYFRKRRRRRIRASHHHSGSHRESTPSAQQDAPARVEPHKRHRRRKRRRDHRPRNPTLAETGGLPPLRTDIPPEPFP